MQSKDKIVNLGQLASIIQKRERGQKVVFTNGCFDLVHLGHIDYLEKAAEKGDLLVVGLNSDQSIKKIKGKNRPIVNENSRSRLLAAMQFVDYVVMFDDETPIELIKTLKPDILIKGNDYDLSNIVGADIVMSNGGKVETVDLVEGYSTSKLIESIIEKNK